MMVYRKMGKQQCKSFRDINDESKQCIGDF